MPNGPLINCQVSLAQSSFWNTTKDMESQPKQNQLLQMLSTDTLHAAITTIQHENGTCHAEILVQVAKDGRQKNNTPFIIQAFTHNICVEYMVSRQLLSVNKTPYLCILF